MEPQNIKFGGGVPVTIVNPLVLVVILIAGVVIFFAARKQAIAAFLTAGILVPTDHVINIAGVHFPMLRVLTLFGFARILWKSLSRGEPLFSGGVNAIDKALIVLATFTAIDGMLLWKVSAEVVYQLGYLYTTFGVYFLVRHLIRDKEDVRRAVQVLACVTIVIAGIMIYEAITGRNVLYAVLGGARSYMQQAGERDDRMRAAGSFAHPILAGTFGGFMLPLFAGFWVKDRRTRTLMGLGIIGTLVMGITANSSTALIGLLAGIGGLCCWPLRRHMRAIRWGIILTLAGGQMYMKSPVWHIISDIDLAGGSSSFHRYLLVDKCIQHFSDWALVGTKDYASWGWDMWDLSNQYVWTADTAGLIPLIAFLAVIVFGFKLLGKMRCIAETTSDRKEEFLVWATAASLFANVIAFLGIDYFDQIIVGWYALLAIIATVTLSVRSAGSIQEGALVGSTEGVFHPVLAPSDPSRKQARNVKTEPSGQERTVVQSRTTSIGRSLPNMLDPIHQAT